jgi:hypothetical protein
MSFCRAVAWVVSASAFAAWKLTLHVFLFCRVARHSRGAVRGLGEISHRSAPLEPQFAQPDLGHPGGDQDDGIDTGQECTPGSHFVIIATMDRSSSRARSGRGLGLTAGLDRPPRCLAASTLPRALSLPDRTGTPFLSSISAFSRRRSSHVGFFAFFTGAMTTWKKAMGAMATETPFGGGSSAGQVVVSLGAKLHLSSKHSGLNRLARTEFASEQWFAL